MQPKPAVLCRTNKKPPVGEQYFQEPEPECNSAYLPGYKVRCILRLRCWGEQTPLSFPSGNMRHREEQRKQKLGDGGYCKSCTYHCQTGHFSGWCYFWQVLTYQFTPHTAPYVPLLLQEPMYAMFQESREYALSIYTLTAAPGAVLWQSEK